jgi:hypothetical protein
MSDDAEFDGPRSKLLNEINALSLPKWDERMIRVVRELFYTAQETTIIEYMGLGREVDELMRIYRIIQLAEKYAQSGDSFEHLRM